MSLLFHCCECARPLNVPEKLSGKAGVCPACAATIQVPSKSEIPIKEFRERLELWKVSRKGPNSKMSDTNPSIPRPVAASQTAGNNPEEAATAVAPPNPTTSLTIVPSEAQSIADSIHQAANEETPPAIPESNSQKTIEPKATATVETGVWFVRPPVGGQFGPANANLFNQWIEEGRVTNDSYVWCEGWADWKLATDAIPALADVDVSLDQNSDQVAATAARTAYMQAKKRRTIRGIIALGIGVVVVIALLIVLFFVIKKP